MRCVTGAPGSRLGGGCSTREPFSALAKYGRHRMTAHGYAAQICYWKQFGELLAAVEQDMMCEPEMLKRTGLTVRDHQRITIENYDALQRLVTGVYIMPVLQGYDPSEYADHVRQFGSRLAPGAWVGVGSVCKRNGSPKKIVAVMRAILDVRPDLKLHGFGLKITALKDPEVRDLIWTADSMAWSFAARREGRNPNDWREALRFQERIGDLSFARPTP